MSTQRFDIRHAPAPRESFRLLYISKSKFGGDWNSTAHTHSCTELFYCLSGEGQFYLSGQLYPVKPDDMIIVNPQVEHTELSLNASPLEYIVLGVAGIEILFGKSDSYQIKKLPYIPRIRRNTLSNLIKGKDNYE